VIATLALAGWFGMVDARANATAKLTSPSAATSTQGTTGAQSAATPAPRRVVIVVRRPVATGPADNAPTSPSGSATAPRAVAIPAPAPTAAPVTAPPAPPSPPPTVATTRGS
jgi:hypothetical protein